jgi:hypothetical protein
MLKIQQKGRVVKEFTMTIDRCGSGSSITERYAVTIPFD